MSTNLESSPRQLPNLAGARLLVPTLQPEPLPLRRIQPAPCTQACPAGINVKAYVSLIAEGRFAEALEVIRRRCPLPAICGRICHHPCEAACRRQRFDDPIAIRALKRFVADRERDFPLPAPPAGPRHARRVAVIGAGPAGLTAAYDLTLAGFPVTVFESEAKPGGMLRYGITAYRLPRDVLDKEIEVLERAGVEIRTGMRLGQELELEGLMRDGFAAVVLCVGAQLGRALHLDGARDHSRVEDALAFLRRVNDGDRTEVGERVLVIGGGSTAVEAARTAKRLGASSVEILYRRSEDELLAAHEEFDAAQREGIRFRFLVAPVSVVSDDDHAVALECAQVGLREKDKSGRREPITIPGTEFVVEADHVYAAVGQDIDLGFLPTRGKTRLMDGRRMFVHEDTAMTRIAGVFAAGDMVTGPSTVIDAIASGHRAAESVRHFLAEGRPRIDEERPERHAAIEYELPDSTPLEATRIEPAVRKPRRGREFAEVEQVLRDQDAVAEAQRCLRCGPCGECRICATTCQRRHIMLRVPGGASPGSTAIVRAPANLALSLDVGRIAKGVLHPHEVQHKGLNAEDEVAVELMAVRNRVLQTRCRGCGECLPVCAFGAIDLVEDEGDRLRARIDPSLCRGCNLCGGVCSTHAAYAPAFAPEWWGARVEDAVAIAKSEAIPTQPLVVLACQRRTGALEGSFDKAGVHVEVIRLRCVGSVHAGLLLKLLRHGASRVLVAGCATDRCRFGSGATFAKTQIKSAQRMLEFLGENPERIALNWSPHRALDPLAESILRLMEAEAGRAGGMSIDAVAARERSGGGGAR